ncbi:hypothetical protein [Tolypothrix sp. VBCCA 56010]|uniref:hypothetical protein n=1 Tax=Tolypothrix sp. VBCCA 56010 TaxID=3137731 RepID=UPI003D7D0353
MKHLAWQGDKEDKEALLQGSQCGLGVSPSEASGVAGGVCLSISPSPHPPLPPLPNARCTAAGEPVQRTGDSPLPTPLSP